MTTVLLIIIALIALAIAFEFIREKPYHAMAVYYAGMFLKRFILPETQVRVTVFIQILLLLFCLGAAWIGISTNSKKVKKCTGIPTMNIGIVLLGVVAFVEIINGYFNGYAFFSMLVDVYKVAEIVLFYFTFIIIWRSTEDMEKALGLIVIEMCLFGLVEMFTTERGGVGLNMVISFAPILFAWGFYERKKFFWGIALCSLLIVFISQTRTYLFGLLLGVLIIFLVSNGKNRKKIGWKGLVIVSVAVLAVVIYARVSGSAVIRTVIERFSELAGGFEEAGGYRIYEMDTAWKKFLENPFFGKGYGYMEYVFIKKQGYFFWGDFMHNAYVEVLAKTGLFGGVLLGSGLIAYLLRQRKEIYRSRESKSKETGILIGGLAGTACWLFIYFAAPLSSYGYVFIPGIVGLLYSRLYRKEKFEQEMLKGGKL